MANLERGFAGGPTPVVGWPDVTASAGAHVSGHGGVAAFFVVPVGYGVSPLFDVRGSDVVVESVAVGVDLVEVELGWVVDVLVDVKAEAAGLFVRRTDAVEGYGGDEVIYFVGLDVLRGVDDV